MDIVVVMFGSLISTMSALTFLEVRRIRKMMESKRAVTAADPQIEVQRKAG
jgi:ribosomal protein L7/L12